MDIYFLSLIILTYLSGSISSAVIVCKLMTLPDPRILGSKNPGATNVLRIGGNLAALLTLSGDILKTFIPLYIAYHLKFDRVDICWLGVVSLIGHCFPLYYSFVGGKGVTTMLTVIGLVLPNFAILAIGCWIISALTFYRSSVASLITALVVPIFSHYFYPEFLLPLSSLSAVVFIRHRSNIIKIIQGIEPKIGETEIKNSGN